MKIKPILTFIALALRALSIAHAQNTVFTYQGRVLDNGTNFTGAGQFQFALVTSANLSSQATATPVMGGSSPHEFVESFNLAGGGNGYVTAPAVAITGGGGSGASATTTITGGSVNSVSVFGPGSGYTSAPMVTIAPPPPDITYSTYWSNDGASLDGSEPATAVAIAVTNGLFTVVLGDTNLPNMDAISAALFNLPNLQLRIWFNDGAHGFAALNPAQSLTPAPYAIYAGSAGGVAATNIVGTLPPAQLPAIVLTNGASGVNLAGTFGGNGAGVTNVPGTLAQVVASGTSVSAQANTAYDLTNSAAVSVTLPPIADVGDLVQVTGTGAGGWQVTEGAVSWTEQTGVPNPADWSSVASSSDGTHLVAVVTGGGIYTSADSEATWTEQTNAPTAANWWAVASSADGTHLVAADYGGGIYTSANSGVTWTEQANAGSAYWQAMASSSDGTHLVAVVYAGGIYTSADSGVTWTEQANAPAAAYWQSVASSSDGTHLVAVAYNSGIYISANSGVTWTEQTGASTAAAWVSTASSSDGTHLVAVVASGGIYTSANSGATWTEQTGAPTSADWYSATSSSDGTHLVAVEHPGGIYASANSGVTWTEQASAPNQANWQSVAAASDGTHLVAVVYGDGIYAAADSGGATAVSGGAGTSEQFQYLGNGVWQPLPPIAGYLSNNGSKVQSLNGAVVTFGAVGIVSASPEGLLEIQGGADGSGANDQHDISLAYRNGGYRHWIRTRHDAVVTGNPTDNAIDFYVNNSASAAGSSAPGTGSVLALSLNGGKVGIANAEPTHLLVVGSAGSPAYCDGTTWVNGSDRNSKEAFTAVDPRAVLDKLSALPITEWQYKVEADGTRHLGPVAQDFHAAFGLNGADDKHIATIDEEGVALAAIQGLNQKLEDRSLELEKENARLKAQNDSLARQMNELATEIKTIEQKK